MKKKLLSAILAGTLALPTVVLPTSVGAEGADDTITVTYSPTDYVIRYGSTYSNTKRTEIAVNTQPANIRKDQDDMLSKYQILAPDAIEKVTINIPSLPLKMKEVNVLDENGQATGEKETVDAIMGMSIFYDTEYVKGIPADGEYYTYKETDPESGEEVTKAVGGTVEEVQKILDDWRTYTFLRKSENTNKGVQFLTLIDQITPTTFGVTDATTKTKNYNVSKDITDIVIDALVAVEDESGQAMFNVIYGPSLTYGLWATQKDYYANPCTNWAKDSTLTVEYSVDEILADINSAEDAGELYEKMNYYEMVWGIEVADMTDAQVEEKLSAYVGNIDSAKEYKTMLDDLLPKDITQHQVDISDKFNVSNWAYVGETIDADTLFIKSASSGLFFAENAKVKDTYQLKAVDVEGVYLRTTDNNGATLATPYYDSTNVENGDVIDFKFDTDTYHANVNNALYIWKGTSETIDGFARHTDKIYLLSSLMGAHRTTLPITVKYTDGTEETVKVWMENRGQRQVVKDVDEYDGVHGAVFSAWPNYAGDFGTNANRIGNNAWARVEVASAELEQYTSPNGLSFNKAKEGATITSTSGGSDGGPLFWSADVDETKIIESITLSPSDATFELYAIGESVISNAEMRAYIADALEKIDTVSPENADNILVARAYADELKKRNVADEEEFAELNVLVEDAKWYAEKEDSKQIMLDISDKLNIDFMAPVGEEVESGWNGSPFSASIVTEMVRSYGTSTYNDGVRIFPLKKYETALNASGTPKTTNTATGELVRVSIPEERFKAGVRDGVYFEPKTGVTETFDASGVRAEALYIAWDFDGATQYYNVTVNYKDGTSETTRVRIAGQWFTHSPQDINAYPCLASDVGFSGNNNAYSAVEGADGKYTMQMTKQGSTTNGLQLYEVKLDASKIPVNYVVTSTSGYDSVIYGLTEKTMSNDDMLAVIAEAEKLEYVSTEEDSKLAKAAAAYARELDERHAVKIEENQLVLDLEEQAIAQDVKYLDLSAQADMDIIVKSDDTEKYASRDDSLLVDFDEYITAKGPDNSDYLDVEGGTVFKLFGGWDGKGNDAVRVAPADEEGTGVTFEMNGEMLKHVSFLADSIDADINAVTGAVIYADVYYTDGDMETVEINLRRGDTWYTFQQAAHYGKSFGSWNAAEGKYVKTAWVTGGNSVPEYAAAYPGRSSEGVAVFGFDIPSNKTVASIKLNPHEKAEFAIIGVTATPYTNDELVASYDAFMELEITEAEEVNGENAAVVLAGYPALKELNERNYQYAWAEDVEYFAPLYAEALKYNIAPDTLKFVPVISVENGNVTAKVSMVNTTEFGQDYILIVAAYDANNQLVGVKSTEQATLASMTYSAENSVTMAVPQGAAKYKALVWESKDSMDPIAIIEK